MVKCECAMLTGLCCNECHAAINKRKYKTTKPIHMGLAFATKAFGAFFSLVAHVSAFGGARGFGGTFAVQKATSSEPLSISAGFVKHGTTTSHWLNFGSPPPAGDQVVTWLSTMDLNRKL